MLKGPAAVHAHTHADNPQTLTPTDAKARWKNTEKG